ncbi:MAG: hypothetical protein IKU25_02440 [Clostridia bacterium]|nr:hypothetical protein [Clostridia bacterium]
MRRTKRAGNFFVCLIFNMLLNLEWSIPAWILLALHYILDISIIWFWAALGLWVLILISWMFVMGWAADCSSEKDPPKENKNPYSAKSSDFKQS